MDSLRHLAVIRICTPVIAVKQHECGTDGKEEEEEKRKSGVRVKGTETSRKDRNDTAELESWLRRDTKRNDRQRERGRKEVVEC